MTAAHSAQEQFRQQRHEFILRYYGMAIADLDRHLKIGWQSIAIIGAAVASLSLGEGDNLPLPVAVTIAIILCFWGMANVLDANYWAVRAIAFLANVEANYLTEEDRSAFNPYLGKHPPVKLMDSLKIQNRSILLFGFLSLAYYVYKISEDGGIFSGIEKFSEYNFVEFLMWEFPIYMTVFVLALILHMRQKRVQDYRNFVIGSPGPGILKRRWSFRTVNLENIDEHEMIPPGMVQHSNVEKIDKDLRRWGVAVELWDFLAVMIAEVLLSLAVIYSVTW